ncbi:MAG TPA: hypothetical protein VMJ35_00020 [Dongiaceae bacterium]|nr:hypothetical protein [Dongiaceae bacterium]
MRIIKGFLREAPVVGLLLVLLGIATIAQAQEGMTIQATARGTSTQMGKIADVNIYIESYSTTEDRAALINAFKTKGQSGMVEVLSDMKPKGRIRFASGGVGNDIKYIFELPPSAKGRKLRLVTDRNLAFAELYAGTRSRDYDVGAIELELTPDGKGTGTVLPACKLTVNKKTKQVEIETYQNPWDLTNFIITKDKK